MNNIPKLHKQVLVMVLFALGISLSVHSAIIQQAITINGNFTDWTSPQDVTNNTGQFSNDEIETAITGTTCLDLDAAYKATPTPNCGLQSTGRDLEKFAYTFSSTHLYLYVKRYASTTNTTEWFFYLDANADDVLDSTERVLNVAWQGSNGNTSISLHNYNPANPAGDAIVAGDGYTMPGSLGTSQTYSLPTSIKGGNTSGANSGREMETQILWSEVCAGCSGPTSIKFHISSGNNTSLPGGIIDNMSGPPGGIITYDLQITKTVDDNTLSEGDTAVYTLTVEHAVGSTGDASDVTVTDVIPADLNFVSASGDGSYDDSTGVWDIGSLPNGNTASIDITVTAGPVATTVTRTNTASLDLPDTDDTNNSDAVDVTLYPPLPLLSITKISNGTTSVNPSDVITYTITVQNMGTAPAHAIELNDDLSDFTHLNVDYDGNAGNGEDPFSFDDMGSSVSINTQSFTQNAGGDGYTYSPSSGAGGASSGFDANVTDWRILMSGTLAAGESFSITYQVEVK